MRSFSFLAIWIVFLCASDVVFTLPTGPASSKGKSVAKSGAAKKVTSPPVSNVGTTGKKASASGTKKTTPASGATKDKQPANKAAANKATPNKATPNKATPNKATDPKAKAKDAKTNCKRAGENCPVKTTEPKLPICPVIADSPPSSRENSPASSRAGSTSPKPKKKTRDFEDDFTSRLFRRAIDESTLEFVGFHGTNAENGALYQKAAASKEALVVPFKYNGNDGELGGGLYVTDDFTTAESFAISSANNRKAQALKDKCQLAPGADVGVVCIVEAKVSANFRANVGKQWIPVGEIARPIPGLGNDPATLALQEARIKASGLDPKTTLRFSALDQTNPGNPKIGNQFMLPPGAFTEFVIRQCHPTTVKPSALGLQDFPAFNYRQKTTEWNIQGDPLAQA